MLRAALRLAGADEIVRRLLAEDALVYGGYSAGPCVLGPTIAGYERTDDPTAVERAYGTSPIYDGMEIVTYVVVPHVDSPGHPASPALTTLADDLEAAGQDVRRLRDGEVLIVDERPG